MMAQQVARRQKQPHEVGRVVADARGQQALGALGERQRLGVGKTTSVWAAKDRDAVVAVRRAGQAQDDVFGLVDAHGRDGGALGEQPVADKLRAPLLVARRRRDLRERAQELELLVVARLGVGLGDLLDLLVHRSPCPWPSGRA